MSLQYFFAPDLEADLVTLDEPESKHVAGVLRMVRGDELLLTNGKGLRAKGVIEDDHRKRCAVRIVTRDYEAPVAPRVTIGISLVKNASRFEWFLEKATEIGVTEIYPLICARTEKEKFRTDRLQGILVSAMLQSKQCWLPVLHEPVEFKEILKAQVSQRFIAHCEDSNKQALADQLKPSADRILLIGPEGDFTPKEIEEALSSGLCPSL
jgi:16S rRNA (uracil1498-N3)-methyltransferase